MPALDIPARKEAVVPAVGQPSRRAAAQKFSADRNVRMLWAASACNSGATWIMQLGIFVHVLQHSSASVLAVVQLAGTVPALPCMPFAGTAADRHDVRGLAMASMSAQAAAVFGMVMLGGAARVWPVAGLYGIQGAAGTLWPPAMQRWLYGVVPSGGWPAANAAIGSVGGS